MSTNPSPWQPLRRFLGHRPPGTLEPIPPLKWLNRVPMQYEVWGSGIIGAMVGLMLIVSIMTTSTVFRDVYHTPVVLTSFGATATLLYGVFESPLSQPRNLIGGHIVCCVIGVCITRIFLVDPNYLPNLESHDFHPITFVNAFVTMPVCLLAMFLTHTVHPPAGAVALAAAADPNIVSLSWAYIPTVIVSVLVMFGWALIINNVGRRRYPKHWWSEDGFKWPRWKLEEAQRQHNVEIKPQV